MHFGREENDHDWKIQEKQEGSLGGTLEYLITVHNGKTCKERQFDVVEHLDSWEIANCEVLNLMSL